VNQGKVIKILGDFKNDMSAYKKKMTEYEESILKSLNKLTKQFRKKMEAESSSIDL